MEVGLIALLSDIPGSSWSRASLRSEIQNLRNLLLEDLYRRKDQRDRSYPGSLRRPSSAIDCQRHRHFDISLRCAVYP